jgi:hypothetical protein
MYNVFSFDSAKNKSLKTIKMFFSQSLLIYTVSQNMYGKQTNQLYIKTHARKIVFYEKSNFKTRLILRNSSFLSMYKLAILFICFLGHFLNSEGNF